MNPNSTHLKKPFVVGTLTGHSSVATQLGHAKKAHIDILEIRLDTFSVPSFPTLLASLRKKITVPFLLTDRSWTEQGRVVPKKDRLSNEQRRKRLQSVLPYADILDLEIRQTSFVSALTKEAHRQGKLVIHSLHEFKNKGNLSLILRMAQLSKQLKGDIFKVAVMPKNEQELQDFLLLGKAIAKRNLILIGMGSVGELSRYLGFSFGSIMTYGHLGLSAAPGQPSVQALRKGIDSIYGPHPALSPAGRGNK